MSVGWGQNISETYMYDYGIDNYYQPSGPEIITSRLLPSCDEGYTEIDSSCYYQSDLDVLQDFIDLKIRINILNDSNFQYYLEWL